MSMNKIKYILLFILSFLLININVYADESCGSWTQSGKEVCEQKEYDGKKCVFKTKDICYVGQEDSNENSDKQCSEYSSSKSECESHSYNGKKCGFMSNVNVCEAKSSLVSTIKEAIEKSMSEDAEWKEAECNTLTTELCNKRQDCQVVGGSCEKNQIFDAPCNEKNIKKTMRFFGYLLMIAKFMVPIIIIGFASFDLYKAIIDSDEKSLNKKLKMIIIRIAAGILVFFIPTLVSVFLGLSDKTSVTKEEQYKICAECVLEPTKKNLCTEETNNSNENNTSNDENNNGR